MANKESSNPMLCDTLGTITVLDKMIVGIIVNPSNTNWSCVITDTAGNEKFRASSTVNESKPFPIRFHTVGLIATTLTNITNILIYSNEV